MRLGLTTLLIASMSGIASARPGDVGEPLVIPSVPFVHRASTTGRAANIARYSCLTSASEAGPEVAYTFQAPSPGH